MPPFWPPDTTPVENSDSPTLAEPVHSKFLIWKIVFAYVLIALYALLFWGFVSSQVPSWNHGDWSGLGILAISILITPLAACGLILASKLYHQKKVLALVTGILALLNFFPVSIFITYQLAGIAAQPIENYEAHQQELKVQQEKQAAQEIKDVRAAFVYDYLTNKFKNPQHVLQVKNGVMLTQDGLQLRLLGSDCYPEITCNDKLNQYAQTNIVGKDILFTLPNEIDVFRREKIYGNIFPTFDKVLSKPADAPEEIFNDYIHVLLYVDGKLTNTQFTGGLSPQAAGLSEYMK